MSAFRAHKLVAALPDPLEPNALYLLRAGAGFDLYASDQTGSVAHKLNAGEGSGGTGGTGGTGGFTPASQSAANAAYIYFDLGNRINRWDRHAETMQSAAGLWADREGLSYA